MLRTPAPLNGTSVHWIFVMKALHRLLNVLFSILTAFFVAGVVVQVLPGRIQAPTIPMAFSLYAIILPTCLQAWITVASWRKGEGRITKRGAVAGVIASTITSYVAMFLAIGSTLMEGHDGYFSATWIAVCQSIVGLFVVTGLVNVVYFSRELLRGDSHVQPSGVP